MGQGSRRVPSRHRDPVRIVAREREKMAKVLVIDDGGSSDSGDSYDSGDNAGGSSESGDNAGNDDITSLVIKRLG
jgi:hypothetical protein